MGKQKFTSLNNLTYFLSQLKTSFSKLGHTHTKSEITDLVIDSALSSSSLNPVQNKAIQTAIQALTDSKADKDEVGVFYVNITVSDEENYSADKTLVQISEAYNKGRSISAILNGTSIFPMVAINGQYAFFLMSSADDGHMATMSLAITADNNVIAIEDAITPEGIGALSVDTFIPTKISDLTNDSGYLTSSTVPVKSVNGKTGAVSLTYSDVGADKSGSANTVQSNLDTVEDKVDDHIADTDSHITVNERAEWNTAYSHSQAAHARTDATKTAKSSTNGNILINGTETVVYTHPSGTNPHGTTKADVGLGNVDNTSDANKPVSTAQKTAIDAVQTNVDTVSDELTDHIDNADIHFTAAERTKLSGIATGANKYTHPNSGVTAGTYKSVTVNAQGHVTSGTNPTTLSGYGITDAEAKGTVNTHNTSTSAHNDIRLLISDLTTQVNNFLDVDDTTKDQLSELIALIEANADDIETITSGKVNVSDIVNNLTTNSSSKVLSAAQGVAIKTLIDTLNGALEEHEANSDVHFTTTERTKLSGIATGAEVNQNAFSNIVIGSTTVAADSKTDTIEFVGSNVTITPDATNDKITFAVANGTTNAKGIVQLTDSTSSTSTSTAATPNSVKSAYDLANTAKTNAATAQSAAEKAQTTADSKADEEHTHTVSEITDLTATATELNYMDGVTSAVQTQLDNRVRMDANTTLNDAISTTWVKYGNRKVTIDGNTILLDMSASTGGYAGAFGNFKDPAGDTTTMLGFYGGKSGLKHFYMGGTYSDPFFKMTKAGQATFKNTPKVGTTDVSLSGHTHSYAGSSSAGGAATSANKVNKSLTVKLNSGTTEGTNMFTFDGSTAKSVNITPSGIGAAASSHTHSYAGSSSANGSANSAVKLDTSTAGSATQPVYFSGGKPVATTYTLGKSVPSDAKFTDTVYTHPSYTARTGVPTANATLTHGGTFTVSQPVSDATGHVTALNTRTYTMPSETTLSKGTDSTASKSLSFGGTFTAVTDTAVSGHKITDTTTTYTMPSDRLFCTLTPSGTAIGSNVDLNTIDYLKVGRYYCSSNATAATLKNCPLSVAFMMEVSSPLTSTIDNETSTWVYRLRKITHYSTGVQYCQFCYVGATAGASNWSYGDWYIAPRSKFTIDTTDNNGGSATIGGKTNPVYVASDGTITASNSTVGSSTQPIYMNSGTMTKISSVGIAYGGTGATTAAGALTNLGLTATATELNYCDGVTSNIQTQLNAKADSLHNHSNQNISPSSLELIPATSASHGGYIDFHYAGNTSDYTSRIWENSSGNITITGTVQVADPTTLSDAKARNITCQTAALTAGTSSLATGRIYLQYE